MHAWESNENRLETVKQRVWRSAGGVKLVPGVCAPQVTGQQGYVSGATGTQAQAQQTPLVHTPCSHTGLHVSKEPLLGSNALSSWNSRFLIKGACPSQCQDRLWDQVLKCWAVL